METVVTRDYLDLRLTELRGDTGTRLAGLKAEMMRWMFGAVGLQTLAILGGVEALLRFAR